MRAGELIGRRVVDERGRLVGYCTDVRCELLQPVADEAPEVILTGLLVSTHRAGSLLGYERGRTRGPWLIKTLVRRLHRGMMLIRWEDVAPVNAGPITLKPGVHPRGSQSREQ